MEIGEVIQAEVRIAQADGGEHGIVLAEVAVSGDVHDPAMASVSTQDFFGGGFAEEEPGVGKNAAQGLRFRTDQWGLGIGDTEDQRTARS